MRTSELAGRAAVNPQTLRYYVGTCDLPRGQRECPILLELDPGPDGADRPGRDGPR